MRWNSDATRHFPRPLLLYGEDAFDKLPNKFLLKVRAEYKDPSVEEKIRNGLPPKVTLLQTY